MPTRRTEEGRNVALPVVFDVHDVPARLRLAGAFPSPRCSFDIHGVARKPAASSPSGRPTLR